MGKEKETFHRGLTIFLTLDLLLSYTEQLCLGPYLCSAL